MIETTGNDLVVIADNPAEMVEAQNATIGKVSEKLEQARSDVADAVETQLALERSGMSMDSAVRMVKRAESRVMFLEKAKQALEAGYVIVPEMPNNVVAIRVNKPPRFKSNSTDGNWTPRMDEFKAPALPAGEGSYVDPMPPTEITKHEKHDKPGVIDHTIRRTTGEWDTDIALPAEFLRPTVVQRTGMTMMRKLFDEIAVVGANSSFGSARAKADPMVVGSVIDKVAKRKLWFLVAWFVDTSTI